MSSVQVSVVPKLHPYGHLKSLKSRAPAFQPGVIEIHATSAETFNHTSAHLLQVVDLPRLDGGDVVAEAGIEVPAAACPRILRQIVRHRQELRAAGYRYQTIVPEPQALGEELLEVRLVARVA